ncbi:MAG: hypothetical protein ABWZ85_05530 [Luteibacter sp.]
MIPIHGSCHCGNLAFDLDWPGEGASIAARACTCTFCVKHGAVWTAHAGASLRVRVADPRPTSSYAFGTGTATFHVCARCGAVPFATSDIDGNRYAVVNVNCFDDFDRRLLAAEPVSFDGEQEATRLARRAARWIAHVTIAVADTTAPA